MSIGSVFGGDGTGDGLLGIINSDALGAGGIVYWDGVSPDAVSAAATDATFDGGEGDPYAENPWDTVALAGRQLPGLCTVKGLPTLKIDQKKKGGADSITFTATGYLPGPIDLSCEIWTKFQWQIFQEIATLVWRKPNKKAKPSDLAIPIYHPGLALWGVSQVIVQGVSTGKPGQTRQSRIFDFRLLEYVGPAKGDKTKTAKPAKPIAKDDSRFSGLITNEAKKPSDTPPGPGG